MHRASCLLLALGLAATAARADLPLETLGQVETLPEPPGSHWVFVSDLMLRRSALVDLDAGEMLGMVSTGFLSPAGAFPRGRSEFYWPETYYSRGSRGERTDVVTFYDTRSLAPVDEVVIPAKRAINVLTMSNAAVSDDDGEIQTPGCSLVYGAGPRRFVMLCADGALLSVRLDARGGKLERVRSERFFDPDVDPVIEKAVRHGETWLFVSFEGRVHPVEVGSQEVEFGDAWSLFDESDRADSWRVGGTQPFAVHQQLGRLYALVHQGGPDTHKEPGTELWVYDLATRTRVQRIEMHHPGLSFMGEGLGFGGSWGWLSEFLLDHVIPNPGASGVQVTQDGAPLLVTGSMYGASLAVYDAASGEFLRRVDAGGLMTHALQAPWGGGAGP
jgi:methylamine dehydrogenase heavy chain